MDCNAIKLNNVGIIQSVLTAMDLAQAGILSPAASSRMATYM